MTGSGKREGVKWRGGGRARWHFTRSRSGPAHSKTQEPNSFITLSIYSTFSSFYQQVG